MLNRLYEFQSTLWTSVISFVVGAKVDVIWWIKIKNEFCNTEISELFAKITQIPKYYSIAFSFYVKE
jgi:hypothetical protein